MITITNNTSQVFYLIDGSTLKPYSSMTISKDNKDLLSQVMNLKESGIITVSYF